MLDVLTRLLPPLTRIMHQIAPSVIATLIAAGLISGYNRAFSGHLQQPRMAMLKTETDAVPLPADTGPRITVVSKPQAIPAAEYFARLERATETPRPLEKEANTEAGKDQSAARVAVQTPAPQPAPRPVAVTPRPEPRVASVPYVVPPPAQPVIAQPVTAQPQVTVAPMAPPPVAAAPLAPPVVVAGPPPVIMAQPPVAMAPPPAAGPQQIVTVPDRAYPQRPAYEAHAEEVAPPPPPRGAIGAIVNTLNPSTWFARAREFGERVEAAGNEILPNIRQ
jgi:hypothetical protein